jgi:hypothetical protein
VRLPSCVTRRIFAAVWHHADRLPDNSPNRYLHHWHVIPRNRFCNVYLHHFLRSDDDRALHDHPWVNASIILKGEYLEHFQNGRIEHRRPGDVVFRWLHTAHRVELFHGSRRQPLHSPPPIEVWTIFITGPKVREWGFLGPQGWVPWQEFLSREDSVEIGPWCGNS